MASSNPKIEFRMSLYVYKPCPISRTTSLFWEELKRTKQAWPWLLSLRIRHSVNRSAARTRALTHSPHLPAEELPEPGWGLPGPLRVSERLCAHARGLSSGEEAQPFVLMIKGIHGP